jgi:hypothetical protein
MWLLLRLEMGRTLLFVFCFVLMGTTILSYPYLLGWEYEVYVFFSAMKWDGMEWDEMMEWFFYCYFYFGIPLVWKQGGRWEERRLQRKRKRRNLFWWHVCCL